MTDRIVLAFSLSATAAADPSARESLTEALSIVRALSPEQRKTHDAVCGGAFQRARPVSLRSGLGPARRVAEARQAGCRHRRAMAPEWSGCREFVSSFRRVGLAGSCLNRTELGSRQGGARRCSSSLGYARTEPSREPKVLRESVGTLSSGLLIEAMVALLRGRPGEASRLADRAAALLENLGPLTSFNSEPFFLALRMLSSTRWVGQLGRAAWPIPPECPNMPTAPSRSSGMRIEWDTEFR